MCIKKFIIYLFYYQKIVMFKILTPLWTWFDVKELINFWAKEFYFWLDFLSFLNKRDNKKAQIWLDEAKTMLSFKKKYPDIKFYIALNEAPVWVSYDLVYNSLKNLLDNISPDAFIVRDFLVIDTLVKLKPDIKLHISSLEQVWNKSWLDFFIDKLWSNLEKFIFPRDITSIEAYDIIKKYPNLEFEVFAFNEWCWNVDGLCSSLHWSWKEIWIPFICNREYAYDWWESIKKIILNRTSCKVCAFWNLKNLPNIISLKIVWRWAEYEQIKRNTIFLKSVVDFLELSDTQWEYKTFCQVALHKKNNADWCKHCEFNN